MSVVMADAVIIPLPRRRIYRDFSDARLMSAIQGQREMLYYVQRALDRLEEEAKWRNLSP